MKKTIITFSITAIISFTALIINFYTQMNTASVDIYVVEYCSVDDFVISSGTVEYSNKKNVKCDDNVIIDETYVKSGDTVKKGDKLFSCTVTSIQPTATSLSEEDIYSAIMSGNFPAINENAYIQASTNNRAGQKVTVFSDYSGIITNMNFSEGDIASIGSTLAVIAPANTMQVLLNINESQISDINIGQKVIITGVGFKDIEYLGEVKKIASFASKSGAASKAATVEVCVGIDNINEKIKSGFTAKCSIITASDEKALIVPYEYICCENDGDEYVYVYNNGYVKKIYIKTGNEYASGVKILKGLNVGDMVVSNPTSITKSRRANMSGKRVGISD